MHAPSSPSQPPSPPLLLCALDHCCGGGHWHRPSHLLRRSGGTRAQVHVKFVPVGVVGAIVPWNYPFHNVFNPMIATLMTGNALVLKVT